MTITYRSSSTVYVTSMHVLGKYPVLPMNCPSISSESLGNVCVCVCYRSVLCINVCIHLKVGVIESVHNVPSQHKEFPSFNE